MPETLYFILGFVVSVLVLLVSFAVLVRVTYRRVAPGTALIVNKPGSRPTIALTGAVVLPLLHRADMMDVTVQTVEIAHGGSHGLICRDNIRADIRMLFFVQVGPTAEDIEQVASQIGGARASDPATLDDLFRGKFSDALKSVAKQYEFVELFDRMEEFRDDVIAQIGEDLNGYVLTDVAIAELSQTPLAQLDPANILDAEGIRKIKLLTQAASS